MARHRWFSGTQTLIVLTLVNVFIFTSYLLKQRDAPSWTDLTKWDPENRGWVDSLRHPNMHQQHEETQHHETSAKSVEKEQCAPVAPVNVLPKECVYCTPADPICQLYG